MNLITQLKQHSLIIVLLLLSKIVFAQTPIISSIQPQKGQTGDVCTIYGSNFGNNLNNVKVYFGNVAAKPISINNSSITVVIPYGINQSNIKLFINNKKALGEVGFGFYKTTTATYKDEFNNRSSTLVESASTPTRLTPCDLNADGYLDYVIFESGTSQLTCLLFDTASNKHQRKLINGNTELPELSFSNIQIEDMNGDGLLDIITNYSGSVNTPKNVTIYFNNLLSNTNNPFNQLSIEISNIPLLYDADGDGLTDIIDAKLSANTLFVYKNQSTTTTPNFTLDLSLSLTIPTVTKIGFSDFNNDTKPDLILFTSDSCFVRLNNATPNSSNKLSFLPIQPLTTFSLTSLLQDMDGDGLPDLLSLNNNIVYLQLNTSSANTASFGNKTTIINAPSTNSIKASDMNGDGFPEILTIGKFSSLDKFSVYENQFANQLNYSTNTFVKRIEYPTSTVDVFDMDANGLAEIGYTYQNYIQNYSKYIQIDSSLFYQLTSSLKQKGLVSNTNASIVIYSTNKFQAGNTYTLEISDENGDFTFPIFTQTITTDTTKCRFNFVVPTVTTGAQTYKLRVSTTSPVRTTLLVDSLIIVPAKPIALTVSNNGFGTAGQLMSINGNNFNEFENIIRVGGLKAKVVSVQSSQIQFIVPFGATSDLITFYSCGVSKRFNTRFNYSFPGTKGIDQNTFKLNEYLTPNSPNTYNEITVGSDLNDDGLIDLPGALNPYNTKSSGKNTPIFKRYSETKNTTPIGLTPDFDGDGKADEVEAVYGSSNNTSFKIKNGTTIRNYPVTGFNSIYSGDMNNDGLFDIITLYSNGIRVYVNSSNIGDDSIKFNAPITISLTLPPSELLILDIDNDEKNDLICAFNSSFSLGLIKNTTLLTTSFAAAVNVNYNVTSYKNLKFTDLNNDNYPDLIAQSQDQFYTAHFFVFINNGSSATGISNSFNGPISINSGSSITSNSSINFVDWDGDQRIDVSVSTNNDTTLFYRNTFTTGVFSGNNLQKIALKGTGYTSVPIDADMDGTFDWIVGSSDLYLRRNLTNRFNILTTNTPTLTHDSLRIAYCIDTVLQVNRTISLQLSDVNGNFNNPTILAQNLNSLRLDNFIAPLPTNLSTSNTRNYKVRLVYSSTGLSSDTVSLNYDLPVSPLFGTLATNTGKAGDTLVINGQGLIDVTAVYFERAKAKLLSQNNTQLLVQIPFGFSTATVKLVKANQIYYIPNKFTATYVKRLSTLNYAFKSIATTTTALTKPNEVNHLLADINNDNYIDAISLMNGIITIRLNDKQQTISLTTNQHIYTTNKEIVYSFAIEDLNGDGRLDIIATTYAAVYFFENITNNGLVKFKEQVLLFNEANIQKVFVGNLNADTKPDILVSIAENNNHYFIGYINHGSTSNFSFSKSTTLTYLNRALKYEILDLDQNGTLDILASNQPFSENRIFCALTKNISVLGFDTSSISTSIYLNNLTADDLDNDGDIDLLYANIIDPQTYIYIGRNTSSGFNLNNIIYTNSIDTISGASTNKNLFTADFDFDGIKDIIAGQYYLRGKQQNPSNLNLNYHKNSLITSFNNFNPVNNLVADFNNDRKTDLYNIESTVPYLNNLQTITVNAINKQLCIGSATSISFTAPELDFNTNNTFSLILSDSNGMFDDNSIILSTINGNAIAPINFTVPNNLNPNYTYKVKIVSSSPKIWSENEVTLPIYHCLSPITLIPNKAKIGDQILIKGGIYNAPIDRIVVYFNKARAKVINRTDSLLTVIVPPHTTYGNVTVSIDDYWVSTNIPFTPTFISENKFDSTCFGPSKLAGVNGFFNLQEIDNDGDGVVEFGYKTYTYNPVQDTFIFNNTYLNTEFESMNYPNSIGDFSGDGVPDFLQVSNYSNCSSPSTNFEFYTRSYIKRNGTLRVGNASNLYTYSTANCYLGTPKLTVGDFNYDGRCDVIASQPLAPYPIVLLTRNLNYSKPFNHTNTPTITSYVKQFSNSQYSDPIPICSGDFNLDGRLDFTTFKALWINRIDTVTVGSFMNGFNKAIDYTTINQPKDVFSADLNNDNKLDFAVVDMSDEIRFYKNQSTNGVLSIAQDNYILKLKNGSTYGNITLEDVNGDGKVDLISEALGNPKSIYIYKNTSTNQQLSFDTINPIIIKNSPSTKNHKFYDMNGDGRIDIIGLTSTNNLVFYKNQFPIFQVKYPRNSFCFTDSLEVELNALDYSFNGSNLFTVQLSDSSGSFVTPTTITNYTRNINQFKFPIPGNATPGKNYKIRIISNNPADTSITPQFGFEIKPSFIAPSISNIGITQKCAGDSVKLSYTNHSNFSTYQWYKNDTLINQTDSTIFVKQAGNYSILKTDNGCTLKSNQIAVLFNSNPLSKFKLVGNTKICSGDSIKLSADTVSGAKYTWYKNTHLITDTFTEIYINDSGNYRLKVTDLNGCSTISKDTFITKVNKPIPTIILNKSNTICQGDSINIQSTNAGSFKYKWRLNNIVLNTDSLSVLKVKTSGNWGIQIKDLNNCTSAWKDTLITVNTNPTISITKQNSGICQGDSLTFIVDNNAGNQIRWYKNQQQLVADTNAIFVIKTNGTYKVKLTNSNQCSATSNDTTIQFKQLPIVQLISSRGNKLCDTDSTILQASANETVTYKWYNNNFTFVGDTNATKLIKTTGLYFVEATSTFGCKTKTNDTLITFNTLPSASLINTTSQNYVCAGDSLKLQTNYSGNYQFKWYRNNVQITNLTSDDAYIKDSGYYHVVVRDSNLCENSTNTIMISKTNKPIAVISSNANHSICVGDSILLLGSLPLGGQNKWLHNNIIIQNDIQFIYANQGGDYKLITDSAGCSSTSNLVTVTENPLPVISISSSNSTTFCNGDSTELTLNPSNGLSIKWYLNNTHQVADTLNKYMVKNNGLIKVEVINTYGCEADSSLNITVNNLPPTPIITKDQNELVSSALNGNQWLLNQTSIAGANNTRITPQQAGLYQVYTTDLNGCQSDTSAPYLYNSTALINSVNQSTLVYPIPVNSWLNISSQFQFDRISVIDVSGKTVLEMEVKSKATAINLSNLANGIYALKVYVNDIGWITKTIMVNH